MIDNQKLIEVMDNINLKHDQEAPAGALPENVDLVFVSVAEEPRVMEGDNGSNNWYPVTFKDAQGSTYDLSLKSLINGAEGLEYKSRKLSERIKAWYALNEVGMSANARKFHFNKKYNKMVTLKNRDSLTIGDKTYNKGDEMPIRTYVFSKRLVG